jgi:hypothetical protein
LIKFHFLQNNTKGFAYKWATTFNTDSNDNFESFKEIRIQLVTQPTTEDQKKAINAYLYKKCQFISHFDQKIVDKLVL